MELSLIVNLSLLVLQRHVARVLKGLGGVYGEIELGRHLVGEE